MKVNNMNVMIKEINERLEQLVNQCNDGIVKEAMLYSLLAPGKRLRPLLLLYILKAYDIDYHQYLDFACAIEMIHTYSLIHDDLPGMDNDDLRRGRPTCHKKFDEATAILAGDALLNLAVNTVLHVECNSDLKIKVCDALFEASGVNGMIYGQQLDLYYENKNANLDQLKEIHKNKTGKLITIPMQIASLIANVKDLQIWTQIGFDLGLAFQIQDDVLDVIGNQELLGKKVGSDEASHKSTYVTLLGIEKSQEMVNDLFDNCYNNVRNLNINSDIVCNLFDSILKRVS